jgi:hypothetical protein
MVRGRPSRLHSPWSVAATMLVEERRVYWRAKRFAVSQCETDGSIAVIRSQQTFLSRSSAWLLSVLHASRLRQAVRELRRYRHLMQKNDYDHGRASPRKQADTAE